MDITVTDIALLIIALSFGVLVIYLIRLILTLNKNLESLHDHVEDLAYETKEIAANFNYKMENLDPIFRAISNVGERAEIKTRPIKEQCATSTCHTETHDENEELLLGVIDFALLGASLWKKFKNRS